jgi:CubicO group peptidase (beta-lactamase class C family)
VMHNDSLIYYYHQGADSTTTGGIASGSKTFSAALMLRLVQQGIIGLDDSIAQYYPFATALGKGSITLRQLFAHTSGLSGSTNYNSDGTITLQQSADSILANDALIYTPIGSQFSYTGEDQQVAGAAAELAAGMPWDTLFHTQLAVPLGLHATYFYLSSPDNPRIAGGIKSSAADMLRFGQFILHNGKNAQGVQVVDSTLMQELWKDQTHRAFQVASPYPNSIPNNNPYHADTVYYGLGTWLDIYNPVHAYQEQISADGAFGAIIWINRCTNMTGVFLTFLPSLGINTHAVQWQAMDVFRNAVPFECYTPADVAVTNEHAFPLLYPNPASAYIYAPCPTGYRIFDATGQLITTNPQPATGIDIRHLHPGVYVLKTRDRAYRFVKVDE